MIRTETLRAVANLGWRLLMATMVTVAVVTVVPGGAAIAAGSTPAACPHPGFAGSTSPSAGQSATKRPVVLVAGWTGSPLQNTANLLKSSLGSKISTYVFDYTYYSSHWPTNANIAACVADYVHAVSDAHKAASGDGKVILVAHSMGGLAIRYAESSAYVPNPIASAIAPWAITFDTPYTGSPWAGGIKTADLAEAMQSLFKGHSMPNPFGDDGGTCLKGHEGTQPLPARCDGIPPYLTGGSTLWELAGDITIKRTLLGIHLYDIPLDGDAIVRVGSSTGYLKSGPDRVAPVVSGPTAGTTTHSQLIPCAISTGSIKSLLNLPGGVLSSLGLASGAGVLTDWGALQDFQSGRDTVITLAVDAGALFPAGCSHVGITKYSPAITQAVSDINAALATTPPVPQLLKASFGSYGKFHTGMSQAAALAALGPGATTSPLISGCAQLFPAKPNQAALWQGSVLTQNGKFLSYFLPPGVSTDRGIHAGSTVGQLRAAYPDAVIDAAEGQAGFYASVYPKGRPDEAIDFEVTFPILDGTTSTPQVPDSAVIKSVAGVGMTGAAVGFEYCSGG